MFVRKIIQLQHRKVIYFSIKILIENIHFKKQKTQMIEKQQTIQKLKLRLTNLQSALNEKQKLIDQYKFIETQADNKIKGMQKIHNEKIKSLLYSIQVLKKQKASIEGLSKEHKRSKLIQQLNKQINDQDLVIEVLRKSIYQIKGGKQEGRKHCDEIIVKALTKGPQRIRPLTREELRMEIQKLREINIGYEKKLKVGNKKMDATRANIQSDGDSVSMASSGISSLTQAQGGMSNTQSMLQRIRSLQLQLQSFKLQSSSKNKIIQKLKSSLLQSDKYRTEVQLLRNQLQISQRKLFSFEKILKENKQSTNKKVIDLYQRELKVQELQMIGQQKTDQLKSLSENHNILLQQIQVEKEELQARYEQLKQQNQKILLQNIANKKHQQSQKNKIQQIKMLNEKQKQNLSNKLMEYQNQVQRILRQNEELKSQYAELNSKVFAQRAQWVEEKQGMIEEIQNLRVNKAQSQQNTQLLQQIDQLRQENHRLQQIFATGQGSGINTNISNNKLLLQRLQAYKRKVQYYENLINKGSKTTQINIYNQLFDKYNKLLDEFERYKESQIGNNNKKGKKKDRKQLISLTKQQKMHYDNLSSGIDELDLPEVDSQILDNFNTSYEYQLEINQKMTGRKQPKITQADKELLKLINSDLWCFIKDDQIDKKLQDVSLQIDQNKSDDKTEVNVKNFEIIRKLKNLSHPQGQKIMFYEEEINKLQQMSDDVSVTSALKKQIENYDSDVNIEIQKLNQNYLPTNINLSKLQSISSSISSQNSISSLQSGDSVLKKKKKPVIQKATKINFKTSRKVSSVMNSESILSEDLMNSDVSSVNISDRELNRIDSDVETDFRKKKLRK